MEQRVSYRKMLFLDINKKEIEGRFAAQSNIKTGVAIQSKFLEKREIRAEQSL
jgi:hypothetical protein